MKLQIGHFLCSVETLPEDADCLGDYFSRKHRIRVLDSLKSVEQAEVLLHEVLHACFDAFGWNNAETFSEETVCTLVAKGLAQVFQVNPMLHEVIHQAVTNGKAIV